MVSAVARRGQAVSRGGAALEQALGYPLMILMLAAFIGYQVYRIALTGSVPMILLTVFDLVVIVLVWIEYRQQIAHRHAKA